MGSDEYVWHANRPVNMILASGVQLPDVLTESMDVKSLMNGEFFSKLIEELIDKAEKRTPADLSSTLKQWKHKETDKSSSPLVPVEPMNGFETLFDLVQRRHLGKLQRYFLNVRPNRHFNPYDLITVPEHQVSLSTFSTSIDRFLSRLDRSRELLRFLRFRHSEHPFARARRGVFPSVRMVSTRQAVEFSATNSLLSKLSDRQNVSKVRL